MARARLAAAPVVNVDETGLRVAGKLAWVHSASTDEYSLITCHERRGTAAMVPRKREVPPAAGVLPAFTGVAVHDSWAPDDTYTGAVHALCTAHVLRELAAVTEQASQGQWCWATQAADALRAMLALTWAPVRDEEAMAAATTLYRSATAAGAHNSRARATTAQRREHALARRLMQRRQDYLRFTIDDRVPFDNNAAEREIRMIKVRQKISGCLRTRTGADQFTAIRSYLATTANHGIATLAALVDLARGDPWLPAPA